MPRKTACLARSRRRTVALAAGLIFLGIGAAAAQTGFSDGIDLAPEEDKNPEETNAGNTSETPVSPTAAEPWWQDQPAAAPLRLNRAAPFADAPDGDTAIALLFSGRFDRNGRFGEFLSVYDGEGRRVGARWRVAASDHVLYAPVPGPGTYVVRLRAGLPDAEGNRLPQSLSGPVTVPKH